MSLINEALKKAQRLRNEDVAEPSSASAAPAGSIRIAKRGKARSANSMVLIGSGAVVLVVLSVVLTVFLVNRSPEAAPRVAAASTSATPTAPAPAPETSPPVIVPVAITPAAPTAPDESNPTQPTTATSPTSGASPLPSNGEPSAGVTPAPVTPAPPVEPTPPAPSTPPAPDPRVTAFVEAIRVTGIRSSGSESRVLMNDRVFRVNDIVDRTLGVRLIKVAADSLTFSDPKGVAYVKNF